MIASRLDAAHLPLETGYLPHRAVAVTVQTQTGPLDIIGVYIPSRDATAVKTTRKRRFLEHLREALPKGHSEQRLLIGDFNVLEPNHTPRYRIFRPSSTSSAPVSLTPGTATRIGFWPPMRWSTPGSGGPETATATTAPTYPPSPSTGCTYVHEPRTGTERLTDHSALTVELALAATAPLAVTDPTRAADLVPALF
ncbi:endonuclease/exonuclease/phosphatase [Streptomyces sp. NPDC056437]|uniref:endonuclease/exonuclease/phosphatase n=1 Tax=Streptomyces sp. NPDC056437 TaxID=3345816 RepID=UPI0036B62483